MADIPQTLPEERQRYWRVPLGFVIRAIVGTLIFGVIAGAAVVLNLAVLQLESYNVDSFIVYGLKFCEYFLFLVDIVLFVIFLIKDAVRTAKQL